MWKMNLRVRILGLIGLFLITLLGIGAWGVCSTMKCQEEMLVEHEKITEAELSVVSAEVCFRRQAEEWKNVLLRGEEEAELEAHWLIFVEDERAARRHVEGLMASVSAHPVAVGLAGKFLRDHQELGERYREALTNFKAGGAGAQARSDEIVRGLPDEVGGVLGELSGLLKAERDLTEKMLREDSLQRAWTVVLAVLMTSLTAFVVLAVALNRWMNLSLLTAGRPAVEEGGKGGEVRYKARREGAKDVAALAVPVWKRVLLVEPEGERRERMAREFEEWGCEVVKAGLASEVAQLMELDGNRSGGPLVDLVVTSSDLPGVGAWAMARMLRAEKATERIPVVLRREDDGADLEEAPGPFTLVVEATLDPVRWKKQMMELLESPPGQEIFEVVNGGGEKFLRAKKVRILAAEDEPLNRKYLGMMLAKVGIDHVLVEDGKQAFEAVRDGDFGVVLMDCGMPVKDGYEATRDIRSHRGNGEGPVVIGVTARSDEDAHQQCRAAGMDAWISKPVKLEYLCLVIEEELAKREARVG